MKVDVLHEAGYEYALRGMAYSYKDRAIPVAEWWTDAQRIKAEKRARLLAPKGMGHSKFLESIIVWIDLEASRAFWSEFDTYRVGMTKNSESSMHTLAKRPPIRADFEEGTSDRAIFSFIDEWDQIKGDVNRLKMALPEGFLQRRMVCTSYMTLRNIIAQRTGHRLKWWVVFIDELLRQVEHPELLK